MSDESQGERVSWRSLFERIGVNETREKLDAGWFGPDEAAAADAWLREQQEEARRVEEVAYLREANAVARQARTWAQAATLAAVASALLSLVGLLN